MIAPAHALPELFRKSQAQKRLRLADTRYRGTLAGITEEIAGRLEPGIPLPA